MNDSDQLAGELPNAEWVVIASAGNVPHQEQPAAFMEAVTIFLSTINP